METVDLVKELAKRLREQQDINLVSYEDLCALSGALEIELINRWQDKLYPTEEYFN